MKIINLFRAIWNHWFRDQETKHLEALLLQEQDNLNQKIQTVNTAIIEQGALCEQLLTKEKELREKTQGLTDKVRFSMSAGDDHRAGRYALELEYCEKDHSNTLDQIRSIQAAYQESIAIKNKAIELMDGKILSLQIKINELSMHKSTTKLQTIATGIITQISKESESFGRLENMVNEEHSKAVAHTKFLKESSTDIISGHEAQYLGAGALERFKQKQQLPTLIN